MTNLSLIRLSIFFLLLTGLGIWAALILSNSDPEQVANQAKTLEAIYRNGNYIEAGIWGIFAIGFGRVAFKNSGRIRIQRLIAAVTFFLFGLSDIVEIQTGAWWHPWWLLIWKSFCVVSMVGLLIVYRLEG